MEEQERKDDEPVPRPIGALVGLGVIVALVLVGLWITHHLRTSASMQDCIASGRTNCAPVEVPAQR